MLVKATQIRCKVSDVILWKLVNLLSNQFSITLYFSNSFIVPFKSDKSKYRREIPETNDKGF